ncbi:hypothetical protein H6G04_34820 [Calothrix membranacea FACHB-236]|nr:hypothetical protein [Calothrix membranacea FACHB-236]
MKVKIYLTQSIVSGLYPLTILFPTPFFVHPVKGRANSKLQLSLGKNLEGYLNPLAYKKTVLARCSLIQELVALSAATAKWLLRA